MLLPWLEKDSEVEAHSTQRVPVPIYQILRPQSTYIASTLSPEDTIEEEYMDP